MRGWRKNNSKRATVPAYNNPNYSSSGPRKSTSGPRISASRRREVVPLEHPDAAAVRIGPDKRPEGAVLLKVWPEIFLAVRPGPSIEQYVLNVVWPNVGQFLI